MSDRFKNTHAVSIEQAEEVHDAAESEAGEETDLEGLADEEGMDVQQGIDTINVEDDVPAVNQEGYNPDTEQEEVSEEIRSTDIVFACPACNHNLAIDYRGAGLQINCTQCGMPTLVPIPGGMEVSDLDISSGELLVQLFQTRTMMHKRDQQITELTQVVESLKVRRSELERNRLNSLHRYAEMSHLCQSIGRSQLEITASLNRMLVLIAEEQQL
jgi:transcription elongation factor Elf1